MLPIYAGLAAVAAATLLYEISLTRLFSIAHGYHFAFLAISLALLGFGASSTVLALRRGRLPGARSLCGLALAGSLGLLGGYLAANRIPFDPYRVAWQPRQVLFLAAYLLALAAPFFLLALVQGLPLTAWPERSAPLYAAILIGSGAGCLMALGALSRASGQRAVVLAAIVGTLGAAALAPRRWLVAPAAAAAALALLLWAQPPWLDLRLSPYKPLSQLLRRPDARVIYQGSNALSRVDVVEARGFRSAPGLPLGYAGPLPHQRALVVDAENVLALTDRRVPRRFLEALPASLPYRLRPGARALVLEPGGGLDVLAALAGGAQSVVAVEGNPLVARLARSIYADRRVRVVTSSPRAYLARGAGRFDVVDIALAENFRPVTAGAFSLSESYALTEEAFRAYLAHLAPRGLLVVQRWLQLPPTEELRAAALAASALRGVGIEPTESLVAFRSFSTMIIVAKRGPLEQRELELVKAFARERGFDLVYYPGIRPAEANRFNVLQQDVYFDAFRNLLAERDRLYRHYEYDVRPPTDDRPFFFHFFKWQQTGTVVRLLGKTWQPFGGSGYLILLALLAVAVVLSAGVVLVPLSMSWREPGARLWPVAYFGALGVGFLLVEVALVQRSIVFLDHPAYSLPVVLFGLLVFASLGSALSERVSWHGALVAVIVAIALYPALLREAFEAFLGRGLVVRALLALLLVAPLGLLLGVPFPRGLRFLGGASPARLPLAWGVNGFASVVSAILAPLIALSFGFSFVFRSAALAYLLALAALIASPARAERRAPP